MFCFKSVFKSSNIFLKDFSNALFYRFKEYGESVSVKCVYTYYVRNCYNIMKSQFTTGNLL